MSSLAESLSQEREKRPELRSHKPWLIAVVITLATFMELLDATVVNVAIMHIAGDYGVEINEASWGITSYMVANAVVLPISGWLAWRFGRKRFYMTCVALFTLSSLACGLAPSLEVLIFVRILQGLVGGGLVPTEQSILADTFPPAQHNVAFAIAGVAMVAAPMLGPTIGGLIVDHLAWRWIFFLNVPIGCLSLALTRWLLPEQPQVLEPSPDGHRIDYLGLTLLALGLGCLQISLDRGQQEDWYESSFITTMSCAALSGIAASVYWLLRHPRPVVDLRLLAIRNFAIANILIFVLYMVIFGSTFLIPLLLQHHLGYTATWVGLMLSPGAIIIIINMPLAARLANRLPLSLLIATGFLANAGALLYFTSLTPQTDFQTFVLARCLLAVGVPFSFVSIHSAAFRHIPLEKNRDASSLLAVSRNIGGSVGIALVVTLIDRRSQVHQVNLSQHLTQVDFEYAELHRHLAAHFFSLGSEQTLAGARANQVIGSILTEQASFLSYMDAFLVLAGILIAVAPLVLFLKRMDAVNLSAARIENSH